MRKLTGLTMMILLTLLVAACGGDDDNNDATETATTGAGVVTEASTDEAAETATTEVTVASAAESSPISTVFAEAGASPAATPASVIATPAAIASPVTAASPAAATPETGSAAVVPAAAVGDDPGATPAATELTLSGRVVLPGGANEAWVITDDGCVGLGTHGDMKAGRQLVVRDAEGAIIGVSMLEDSGETDTCAWTFALDVPESPFYAVSIPMVVEHIFTQQEVEQNNGAVVVPIG